MKYIVERASDCDNMPCRDCVYEEVHEIEWNGIVDSEPTKVWTKEIDSLVDFVDKYGSIILEKSSYKEIPYKVIIYDGYIE